MPERLEEIAAAAIVERVSGCSASLLDTGASGQQLVDYALLGQAQEQIGVLEVTTATVEDWMSFYSHKHRANRSFFDRRLTNSWSVVMGPPRIPRRFKSKLAQELRALERIGCTSVSVRHDFVGVEAGPIPTALQSLGVTEASVLGGATPEGGLVAVSLESHGSAIGVETVTSTVEALANEPGNLAKLRSGPGPRAELFAWFNPPHPGLAALIMNSEQPFLAALSSARPPDLPDGVTAVWAAAYAPEPEPHASFLWFSEGAAWEIVEPGRHQSS